MGGSVCVWGGMWVWVWVGEGGMWVAWDVACGWVGRGVCVWVCFKSTRVLLVLQ